MKQSAKQNCQKNLKKESNSWRAQNDTVSQQKLTCFSVRIGGVSIKYENCYFILFSPTQQRGCSFLNTFLFIFVFSSTQTAEYLNSIECCACEEYKMKYNKTMTDDDKPNEKSNKKHLLKYKHYFFVWVHNMRYHPYIFCCCFFKLMNDNVIITKQSS